MKKLLFVIESLNIAGAEKSLVTLLNLIDYSKYEVDLQLFSYGGELQKTLPEQLNLLPPLPFFDSLSEPLSTYSFHYPIKYIKARIAYSSEIRRNKLTNPEKAVVFWKLSHDCFDVSEKEYDAAIAYAQGTPTFYVADCVKASRKYAWVNVTYKPDSIYRDYNLGKYCMFDRIVCVSETTQSELENWFPELRGHTTVIRDMMDEAIITEMANWDSKAEEDMKYDGIKLLTVGRLAKQKGYDIALDACEILKNRGLSFKWYILGRGYLKDEIKKTIKERGLVGYIQLLGTRANPYPYFKQTDIYVQTSRFEGFGIAIAEARILNIPVVTTEFDAVYTQMVNGENGLVVNMDAVAVADGIERLMTETAQYNHIREYQTREKKGNTEELLKFYELIES